MKIIRKILLQLLIVLGGLLPPSHRKPFGCIAKKIRTALASLISPHIGRHVNIEKGAYVLCDTVVGDYSGIGINCEVCPGLVIGKNVMMGPECIFYSTKHKFNPKTRHFEGYTDIEPVIIEDDVWLGRRVIVTGGVRIGRGAIIGAGSVVTKDIPPYTMAAGNPAVVKKHLLEDTEQQTQDKSQAAKDNAA